MATPEMDATIVGHYTESERLEDDRLKSGGGRIEFLRTQELIRRHLPCTSQSLDILDVGGASGVQTSAVTFSETLPVRRSVIFCLAITVKRWEMAAEVDHFFSPLRM